MIGYGISELAVIPVRKEASEQSEMVTQILFGETFQVLEENQQWCYVKLTFDNYQGWINSKTFIKLSEQYYVEINTDQPYISRNFSDIVLNNKKEQIIIPFGSSLPNYSIENNTFKILDQYTLETPQVVNKKLDVNKLSKVLLNAPYLWGGKNPFGVDCSGFVQMVFKILGKKLPRDASQQATIGETVNFNSETVPGDLAFFDDSNKNITHVGIILNDKKIIHASGKVQIDTLDQQGIFNTETEKYSHNLRIIKRIS